VPCDYGLVDGWIVRGGDRLIALGELQLVGRHNAANAMAALALCEAIGIPAGSVLPALAVSGVLPIASSGSPKSMASATSTTRKAPTSAPRWRPAGPGSPVAIILGGDGKGQDFSPLKPASTQHARAVALIGRDAPAIAAVLEGCQVPLRIAPTWRKRCAGALPRRERRRRAALAGLRQHGHVSQLRASRRSFVDAVRRIEREAA
jgi:UDP-N-acetylmuramoylalanine--D-glutamate ligase